MYRIKCIICISNRLSKTKLSNTEDNGLQQWFFVFATILDSFPIDSFHCEWTKTKVHFHSAAQSTRANGPPSNEFFFFLPKYRKKEDPYLPALVAIVARYRRDIHDEISRNLVVR